MKTQVKEQRLAKLIDLARSYLKESEIKRIRKAWSFAKKAHADQQRLTGENYAYHGLETAFLLVDWGLDSESIIAGFLHDTIEDAGIKEEEIKKEFGHEVARLVKGVTKVSHIRLRGSQDEDFVENLRKMFLAMAKDLRVVLVKLADRLHNMRTLYALPLDKQKKIARETLEIYAPLAERLGIGEVKGELEDLAFPYLYPKEFRTLKKEAKKFYKKAEVDIKKMKQKILKSLAKQGIRAKLHARKKHLYSLWKKLQRPEIEGDFTKIHDIVALRIIVNKIHECYTALGIVHRLYKPVPFIGISDFIAQPKPNGYRSIHSKVFGPGRRIVEVQIRTCKMHEEAEYGIASHWVYSESKSRGIKARVLEEKGVLVDKKFFWVRQLASWQKEISDSREFLKAVKFDALKHRNFVFSPKGDVYDLPAGATPVDFAFAVHTHLGRYIKSAKVNGILVSLNYKLKSGDVVEIVKSKKPRSLNKGWLDFVVTTVARREIEKSLKTPPNSKKD